MIVLSKDNRSDQRRMAHRKSNNVVTFVRRGPTERTPDYSDVASILGSGRASNRNSCVERDGRVGDVAANPETDKG